MVYSSPCLGMLPRKHVHLSSTYQDSETTKPLKRHSSRRMLVINHLPSEFQGPKAKKTPHVLPANHAPFPLKNYGPPMASSPDHEESKNQTILGTSGPGPPSFHERWVAPDPKTIPRDPQETVPTSWLKVYQQLFEVSAVGVQPGGVHLDSNLL